MKILAAHPQGMNRAEIAGQTRINEGPLSKTLDELTECNFISLFQPFQNKRKDAVYKLTGLYSLFYLKFIQPNKEGGDNIWEQLAQQSTYTAWSGYAFENICMAHRKQIIAALQNKYYLEEIDSEITMGKLFEKP